MRPFWQWLGIVTVAAMQMGCAASGKNENHKIIAAGNNASPSPEKPHAATEAEATEPGGHALGISDARPSTTSGSGTKATGQDPAGTNVYETYIEMLDTEVVPIAVADDPVILENVSDPGPDATIVEPRIDSAAPSLQGLDRSHWANILIGPADGATHHGPVYFRDVKLLPPHPGIAARVDAIATLEGASAGNLNRANLASAALQPLKMGADTILFPLHAVMDPPWSLTTTPKRHRTVSIATDTGEVTEHPDPASEAPQMEETSDAVDRQK